MLKNDVRVFFCKYNDPIYVKLAKLEIMYRLARAENAAEVLAELQECVVLFFWIYSANADNLTVTGMLRKSISTLCEKQYDR